MRGSSGTSCWIPNGTATARWSPTAGLLGLPEPADGDLFFDIEGARYYSEDGREFGLQYRFGVVDTAEAGEAGLPRYAQIWAYDRTERRERHPGLHVYHYNHYEPTSVDHLTELHGPRHLPDWSTSRTRMRPYWLAGW